jgi:hypothetical protein
MSINIAKQGNTTYIEVFSYLMNISNSNTTLQFEGTPYTVWGGSLFSGVDAIDFGNRSYSYLPLTYMTHGQVLSQLSNPDGQFAFTEYAAADVYISKVCRAINNTAPICSLPAIQKIESDFV